MAEILGGGCLGGGINMLSIGVVFLCGDLLLDLVFMLCLLGLGEGVLIFLFGSVIKVYEFSSESTGLVACCVIGV